MAYRARNTTKPQFVANPLNPISYLQLFPRSTRKYLICYLLFWIFVGLYFVYTGFAVYLFKMAYSSVFGASTKPMYDILAYFPEVSDDATRITWSHATNSKKLLYEALNGPTRVMVLESDILMKGGGTSHQELLPIMAHPPATDSDLTFDEYLASVTSANATVGIKLDFKAIEVVELCLQTVAKLVDKLPGPVIVNADILRGPGAPIDKEPIDHRRFLRLHSELTPRALLSIGWTTGYPAGPTADCNCYGWEHVVPMWELVAGLREKASASSAPVAVTFPVRASLLANSLTQLRWLIDAVEGSGGGAAAAASLTVWMAKAPGEPAPDPEVLRRYRAAFGCRKLFVDLPGFPVESLAVNASSDVNRTSAVKDRQFRLTNASLSALQPDDWTIAAFPPSVGRGFGRGSNCVAGRAARLSLHSRRMPPSPTSEAPLRLVGDAQFGAGVAAAAAAATAAGVSISLLDGGLRVAINASTGSVRIVEFEADGSTERRQRRANLSSWRPEAAPAVIIQYSIRHWPDRLSVEAAFLSGASMSKSLMLTLTDLAEGRRSVAYAPLITLYGGEGSVMAVCHLRLE